MDFVEVISDLKRKENHEVFCTELIFQNNLTTLQSAVEKSCQHCFSVAELVNDSSYEYFQKICGILLKNYLES